MLKRLWWCLLLACGTAFAAGEAEAGKIAADAELLESSVSAMEDAFREGLAKADMTGSRAAVRPAREKAAGASMRLSRLFRFRGHPGCDGTLVCRWGYINELGNLLDRSICGERPDFALKLEENTSADAAALTKNCISIDMQLPIRFYSAKNKPKRDFGEYQNNLEVLKDSGKRKAVVLAAQQWRGRVKLAEFYFWAVHKNAALVREDPEQLGGLPEFLLRQLEDAKKMVGCALNSPRNSPPAAEFSRKLLLIRNASAQLATHARRNGKGDLAKNFSSAYKLGTIFLHWNGAIPYCFYWAEADLNGLGDQASDLLAAQIPFDPAYLDAKAEEDKKADKEKADKEKEEKKSKGKKGKKKKDAAPTALVYHGLDRIAGEDDGPGGDGDDGGAPGGAPGGGAAKKGKAVSFEDSIKEYNLQIFEENGSSRRDARIAAQFKRDMTEFAQILSALAKGVGEFREAFPDALRPPAKK